jgi:hypothetical protein
LLVNARELIALAGAAVLVVSLTVLGLAGTGISVVGEEKLDQRLTPGRVTLTDAAAGINSDPSQGRYEVYTTLAELAPGVSAILLADDLPFDENAFRAFGKGERVVRLQTIDLNGTLGTAVGDYLSGFAPRHSAVRTGLYRHAGAWWDFELHALGQPVERIFLELGLPAGRSPGEEVLYLIDARLLDPSAVEAAQELIGQAERAPVLRLPSDLAWGAESAVLLAVLLLGGLLLPRMFLTGPARPAAALIAGLALQSVLGAFGLGWGVIILPVLGGISIAVALRRRGIAAGWVRSDTPPLLAAAGIIGAGVFATRALGLVHVSTDTAGYLGGAFAQAQSATGVALPTAKSPGFVALHASANIVGADALFALGPVALLAGLVLIAQLALRAPRNGPAIIAFVVVAGVFGGTEFLRRMTMLPNSHIVVAALLLLMVVLWIELCGSGRFEGGAPLAALLGAAVVLGRPEGVAYVALLLAGTLGSRNWRHLRSVWALSGAAVAVGAVASIDRGAGALDRTQVGLLTSGFLLMFAPIVFDRLPAGLRRVGPALALAVPWVLLFAVRTDAMRDGVVNARTNLFESAGGWGLAVVSLLLLFGVASVAWGQALRRGNARHLFPLWLFIAGYAPMVLLIRGLGSATGGRVHWHDSVNRMWAHLVLVLALFVVMSVRTWQETDRSRPPTGGWRGWSALATAGAAGAIALPGLAWAPLFASEKTRDEIVVEEQPEWDDRGVGDGWRLTGIVGPELAGLQSAVTVVPLELDVVGSESMKQAGELCVGVRLGTFDRELVGQVEITVESGALSASGNLSFAELEDSFAGVARARSCFALTEEGGGMSALGDDLLIMVRGQDARLGSAPAVILDSAGNMVVSADLRWSDSPQPRESLVRRAPPIAAGFTGLLMLAGPLLPRPRRGD